MLVRRFDVTAVGTGDPDMPTVRFLHAPILPRAWWEKAAYAVRVRLHRYAGIYFAQRHVAGCLQRLAGERFELVVGNDLDALPLAVELGSRCGGRVVYDAHEYSPREAEESWAWRFWHQGFRTWLCRRYLPRVQGMMTVCPGIADEYRRQFGVAATVVVNAPRYHRLPVRDAVGDPVRAVHHGAALAGRGLERMIEVIARCGGRYTLDMLLVRSCPRYFARLERAAAACPWVRILPPVPLERLVPALADYDLGLYLLAPSSFNNLHALPNKFFEFLQARLAVAVGPSPEMAAIIRAHGCGVVARSFAASDMAETLLALDPERIRALRSAAASAALACCAEREAEVIDELIDRVLRAA